MLPEHIKHKVHEHSVKAYIKVKCLVDRHPRTTKTTFTSAHLVYFGAVIIEGHGMAAIAAGIMFFVTTVQSVWGNDH